MLIRWADRVPHPECVHVNASRYDADSPSRGCAGGTGAPSAASVAAEVEGVVEGCEGGGGRGMLCACRACRACRRCRKGVGCCHRRPKVCSSCDDRVEWMLRRPAGDGLVRVASGSGVLVDPAAARSVAARRECCILGAISGSVVMLHATGR